MKEHIKCVLVYEKSIISLVGDENCKLCCWISNLLFDLSSFIFYNTSFTYKNVFCKDTNLLYNSKPIVVWCMVFIHDKWFIIAENKIVNDVVSLNGQTYEEIFNKSWGYNKLSILPKNECHFFYKTVEGILKNSNKMSYILSAEKNGTKKYVNEFFKKLFPTSTTTELHELLMGVQSIKGQIFFIWIHEDYYRILTALFKLNSLKETFFWARENNQLRNLINLFPSTKKTFGRLLLEMVDAS